MFVLLGPGLSLGVGLGLGLGLVAEVDGLSRVAVEHNVPVAVTFVRLTPLELTLVVSVVVLASLLLVVNLSERHKLILFLFESSTRA